MLAEKVCGLGLLSMPVKDMETWGPSDGQPRDRSLPT